MPDITTSALSNLSMYGNSATATSAARSSTASKTEDTTDTSLTKETKNPYELTMSDFYTLLATQIQYQDADNPMDTSEMVSQLVQNQMSEAITQMSTAVSDLSTVNLLNYASSMMGKEVTVAEVDKDGYYTGEELKGVVSGVSLGTVPTVVIDGKEYSLVQIMGVGTVPEKPDPEEPDEGDTEEQPDVGDTETV
ncbi:MAG TPA: hypothetical protein H9780_06940 [Candidatus Mediterraneibacter merdavium]|nr:hypothetical protein [Candidatus Mediterraneibacter merdavium]